MHVEKLVMDHVIEPAASGRSKCRGCGLKIDKGTLRFGERLPNPFAEGETTLWFHLPCAAFKRPQSLIEALDRAGGDIPAAAGLRSIALFGTEHPRTQRVDGLQKAPSGRARCRGCRKPIARGAWRIPLVYFEEGAFNPSGFVHLACSGAYFGTSAIVDRLEHFAPERSPEELAEAGDLLRRRA